MRKTSTGGGGSGPTQTWNNGEWKEVAPCGQTYVNSDWHTKTCTISALDLPPNRSEVSSSAANPFFLNTAILCRT
jgi:hypothetical protein